jgi:alpha-D-xyloside xylohydrolase
LPLYVRAGTILPLADPVPNVADDTVFNLTCKVFGPDARPCVLFEDDGITYNYEQGACNELTLTVTEKKGAATRSGNFKGQRYQIAAWEFVE